MYVVLSWLIYMMIDNCKKTVQKVYILVNGNKCQKRMPNKSKV